jgi:hypothetical protein
VNNTIRVLVSGLESHGDEDPLLHGTEAETARDSRAGPLPGSVLPKAWIERQPDVLCVAGRGSLDETAAIVLGQLLRKRGFAERLVTSDEVSRQKIGSFDSRNVAIACIVLLDVEEHSSHLRFLVQRLRQSLPKGSRIIAGLWPLEEIARHDEAARAATGADLLAASLENTVDLCIQSAIQIEEIEADLRKERVADHAP